MRSVKSKDTAPEMVVRRLLHTLGYRYTLHSKQLPGSPDIILSKRRIVIFVHGCFWHGHTCARGARMPKTNSEYWRNKIDSNGKRDRLSGESLRNQGWRVLTVWECETKNRDVLTTCLQKFISDNHARDSIKIS